MSIAKSHWSGFCYTVDAALTGTPFGYLVVTLCHEDPAALGLHDPSLPVLPQITDGVDVGGS